MTKARDIADSDLGSLTVDTDTLVVDETNNRVGIGTSSPSSALDVQGDVGVSGGIYLGGTGSANKLDDYEEGTWTPSIDGLTFNLVEAEYTKVGNLVYVSLVLNGGSGSANNNEIQGLPFLGKSSIIYPANSIYIGEVEGGISGLIYHGRVEDGASIIRILRRDGAGHNGCSNSEVPTESIRFSFSYLTDS